MKRCVAHACFFFCLASVACNGWSGNESEFAASRASRLKQSAAVQRKIFKKAIVTFFIDASIEQMYAIGLQKLVLEHPADSTVKRISRAMFTTDSLVLSDLKILAAQKRILLPATIDPAHHRLYEKLELPLTPAEFRYTYFARLRESLEARRQLYSDAELHIPDSGIKAFIDDVLPKIKLQMSAAGIRNLP